jgi:hypothetical protein
MRIAIVLGKQYPEIWSEMSSGLRAKYGSGNITHRGIMSFLKEFYDLDVDVQPEFNMSVISVDEHDWTMFLLKRQH